MLDGSYRVRKEEDTVLENVFILIKGKILWLKMKQTQQPAIHVQQHTLVRENSPLACMTLLPGHKRHNVADCEWNNRA